MTLFFVVFPHRFFHQIGYPYTNLALRGIRVIVSDALIFGTSCYPQIVNPDPTALFHAQYFILDKAIYNVILKFREWGGNHS